MELRLSSKKGATIQQDMIGLFFEDINYAADGGLYAEMLENRAFEFVDCYGTVGIIIRSLLRDMDGKRQTAGWRNM